MNIDGEQLINTIARCRDKDNAAAKDAFALFCSYYENRATQMAIVICRNWKKPENYAYQIVQCAFQKVWLYPTFNKEKTCIKDIDTAILHWINVILYHELTLLSQSGDCSHPEAEDLPLITNSDEFIGEYSEDEYVSDEESDRMRRVLDTILRGLNEKEVTIYLTYKLYERPGKKIPRSVLKKLRLRYNMSQDAIRKCHWRVQEQIEGKEI